MSLSINWLLPMDFPKHLVQLRKKNHLTQQHLSELVHIHVNQIKRYEAGTAQPTLDALIKLAKALRVSLDALVFNERERGPNEELALQFEAISQLATEEQNIVKEVLESLIIKYQTRRWDSSRSATKTDSS
jgi:transcriptional regulator with XRE-family HTH domain